VGIVEVFYHAVAGPARSQTSITQSRRLWISIGRTVTRGLADTGYSELRKGAVAVGERDAQDLERLGSNETSIKDDRNLTPSPGGEHLLDQWLVECTTPAPFTCQKAPNACNAADGLRIARNMVADLTQLDRLSLD
jgi:hypothetical protein